jgi:dihydroflavonol-4-reductase
VDVRDVAAAHVAALERPGAAGRFILASGTMTMAEVAARMRAAGYVQRLPRFDLSGRLGTALAKLASFAQPKGVGVYLRTHLGRHPRFDNGKSRRELGITYRSPDTALSDTLADLVRWGHIDPPTGP